MVLVLLFHLQSKLIISDTLRYSICVIYFKSIIFKDFGIAINYAWYERKYVEKVTCRFAGKKKLFIMK